MRLNIWYDYYWNPDCWTPRKCVPPKVKTYKILQDREEYNEWLIRNKREGLYIA